MPHILLLLETLRQMKQLMVRFTRIMKRQRTQKSTRIMKSQRTQLMAKSTRIVKRQQTQLMAKSTRIVKRQWKQLTVKITKSRWTFNVCSVLLILNYLIDYMQCDIVLYTTCNYLDASLVTCMNPELF